MATFTMGDKYSAFLYDAVLLYAIALNETIDKGLDPRSGIVVAKGMRAKVFRGEQQTSVHFFPNISTL